MNKLYKFMSRKFLMILLIFIVANLLIWFGKIGEWVWFSTMMVVGIGYPFFNILYDKVHVSESTLSLDEILKEIKEITALFRGKE